MEKIENVYKNNELVDQMFVYGNSEQNYIVCVVVPAKEKLVKAVDESHCLDDVDVSNMSFKDLCERKEVRKMVLEKLNETALKANVGEGGGNERVAVRIRAREEHPPGARRVVREQQHAVSVHEAEAFRDAGGLQGSYDRSLRRGTSDLVAPLCNKHETTCQV